MTARPDATLGADERGTEAMLRAALRAIVDECGGYVPNTPKAIWRDAVAALAAPAGSVATDEQILSVANRWVKEPGWMDFETTDFLSCARALIAEFAAPAVVVSAEPVALLDLICDYWDLAVAEGREGRNHDTVDGKASALLSKIADRVKALEARATPVGPDAVDALAQARAAIRWLTFGEKDVDGFAPKVSDVLAQIDAALASTKPSADEGASRG